MKLPIINPVRKKFKSVFRALLVGTYLYWYSRHLSDNKTITVASAKRIPTK